jgi:uncharacterized protein
MGKCREAMRLVIDTNILVASLSSKSKYHWIIQALRDGKFELCITEEIYLEYEEILKQKYNVIVANAFLNSLKELSNVIQTDIFYKWLLIQSDPDDDKFVDCAVAGNVDFLVTNDRHYNVLKTIGFPPVNVISLEGFEKICWGGLEEQIIQGDNYQIKVESSILTIIHFYDGHPREYQIYKNDLIAIRNDNDSSKLSNLILHLSQKTWILDKISILYDLAEIAQNSFPLNEIDWEETFHLVGYDSYISRLEKPFFNRMTKYLNIYSEESSDIEFDKNLKEGVREELKKRKII